MRAPVRAPAGACSAELRRVHRLEPRRPPGGRLAVRRPPAQLSIHNLWMGEERRAQGRASFGSYRMTGADVVHVAAHTAFDADPIAPGLVVGAVNAARS